MGVISGRSQGEVVPIIPWNDSDTTSTVSQRAKLQAIKSGKSEMVDAPVIPPVPLNASPHPPRSTPFPKSTPNALAVSDHRKSTYHDLFSRAIDPGLSIPQPALIILIMVGAVSLIVIVVGLFLVWQERHRRNHISRRINPLIISVTTTTAVRQQDRRWSIRSLVRSPPSLSQSSGSVHKSSGHPSCNTLRMAAEPPAEGGRPRDVTDEPITPLSPVYSPSNEKTFQPGDFSTYVLHRQPEMDAATISTAIGESGSAWSILQRDRMSVTDSLPGYSSRPPTARSRGSRSLRRVPNIDPNPPMYPTALARQIATHRILPPTAREYLPRYSPSNSPWDECASGSGKKLPLPF